MKKDFNVDKFETSVTDTVESLVSIWLDLEELSNQETNKKQKYIYTGIAHKINQEIKDLEIAVEASKRSK